MSLMTEERIRLIIDTDYDHRQAVKLHAARTGQTVSDAINRLIEEHMAEDLRQVRAAPRATSSPTGKKRGRKPKGDK